MLKLVLGKQQACFPALVRQQHLKMSRRLVRHEWHIVDSKTVPASAMPKPAPFAKLTSRLACFFFFSPSPEFLFWPKTIVSVSLKILELVCHPEENVTGKGLLRNSPTKGNDANRWTGRSQRVQVSFFFLWRQRVDMDLEKEAHKRNWWIF